MTYRNLITPHGDLKRLRRSWRLCRAGSHYPSWGFETQVAASVAAVPQSSLPLMGI